MRQLALVRRQLDIGARSCSENRNSLDRRVRNKVCHVPITNCAISHLRDEASETDLPHSEKRPLLKIAHVSSIILLILTTFERLFTALFISRFSFVRATRGVLRSFGKIGRVCGQRLSPLINIRNSWRDN